MSVNLIEIHCLIWKGNKKTKKFNRTIKIQYTNNFPFNYYFPSLTFPFNYYISHKMIPG